MMVVEIYKKFIFFGKYKDNGKCFMLRMTHILKDNSDTLNNNLLPTVHYFKSKSNMMEYKKILISEYTKRDLKKFLKKIIK